MVAVPALATLGIGVAVGHSITPAAAPPPATVTVTAPAGTAIPAANPPTSISATTPNPFDGKQLGSYDITIVPGYSVPIGETAPTQPQFVHGNGSGDLYLDPTFATFGAVGATNKIFRLAGNAAPTYQACKSTTLFATSMPSVTGSTFCLSEQGRMVGVTMAATSHTAGEPDTLSVIVWQDS